MNKTRIIAENSRAFYRAGIIYKELCKKDTEKYREKIGVSFDEYIAM